MSWDSRRAHGRMQGLSPQAARRAAAHALLWVECIHLSGRTGAVLHVGLSVSSQNASSRHPLDPFTARACQGRPNIASEALSLA